MNGSCLGNPRVYKTVRIPISCPADNFGKVLSLKNSLVGESQAALTGGQMQAASRVSLLVPSPGAGFSYVPL